MRTRDENKQQRIKEAMVRLILREGIEGTSVSKIAREAGVSPATIYVYYDSKEEMMAEVFREYSNAPYRYLMRRLSADMDGGALIDAIVRGCYSFSREHEEIFSFVEQCSRCPTLCERVSEQECCCDVFSLLHAYQARGVLRPCSDLNLAAVLLAPVRFLAVSRCAPDAGEQQLPELIGMLQRPLLC